MLKKAIKRNTLIFLGVFVFIIVTNYFGITCPILYILKIPCPTCGTTRAIFSLARLDFQGYFHYNPMALFLCVAVVLMLNIDFLKKKKLIYLYSISVAVINFIFWIYKLAVMF